MNWAAAALNADTGGMAAGEAAVWVADLAALAFLFGHAFIECPCLLHVKQVVLLADLTP